MVKDDELTAAEILENMGGTEAVIALTGVKKAAISHWRTGNHIPDPWVRLFKRVKPSAFARRKRRAPPRPAAEARAT